MRRDSYKNQKIMNHRDRSKITFDRWSMPTSYKFLKVHNKHFLCLSIYKYMYHEGQIKVILVNEYSTSTIPSSNRRQGLPIVCLHQFQRPCAHVPEQLPR